MPYEYLIAANTFKFPNNNFGPIHATLFYFINALSLHSCMNHMNDANTTINHCTCCFRCMSASWVCMTHCIFIILSLSFDSQYMWFAIRYYRRERKTTWFHTQYISCLQCAMIIIVPWWLLSIVMNVWLMVISWCFWNMIF